jgi:hypothetical protein
VLGDRVVVDWEGYTIGEDIYLYVCMFTYKLAYLLDMYMYIFIRKNVYICIYTVISDMYAQFI